MYFGVIGVEGADVWKCGEVETGEVVHGVFSLVVKALFKYG